MILEHYQKLVEASKLKADAAQRDVAEKFDGLEKALVEYVKPGFWWRRKKPKGLFLVGKVGRGKTMLMDLFYNDLQMAQKQRVHFHEFMQDVHLRMRAARDKGLGIDEVAAELGKDLKLLCFDEYEINDVADAMILSKLFRVMADSGVVFVFTSNKPPREHYKEGLQRQSYLEFCDYLEEVLEVVSLDAERDYRMVQAQSQNNFFVPLGYEATAGMKERFKALSVENLEKVTLDIDGRELEIRAAGKIAWADFNSLCGVALGNADYIKIAVQFDILFLENVPVMDENFRNQARRFINLIDILYEHKTLLIASFAVEPDGLYLGQSGAFEFARTASRLTEMRGWVRRRDLEERF